MTIPGYIRWCIMLKTISVVLLQLEGKKDDWCLTNTAMIYLLKSVFNSCFSTFTQS